MKILRIVLVVIGYLFLLVTLLSLFNTDLKVPDESTPRTAYYIGYFLGFLVFPIPPMLCFYFAWRIKRRLRKQSDLNLVESLPD